LFVLTVIAVVHSGFDMYQKIKGYYRSRKMLTAV
jgi:hypothetical protein